MEQEGMKLTMMVEKTDTGFSAYCEEYPIFTTGSSIPRLMDNCITAANLFFDDQDITINHDHLRFEIDFKQFFQYYKVINSKFLADKIDMNPTLLSQYVQGRKKPSDKQAEKIIMGIHQIGKELAEINLIFKK